MQIMDTHIKYLIKDGKEEYSIEKYNKMKCTKMNISGCEKRKRKRRAFIRRFGDNTLTEKGVRNGLPTEIIFHILGFCPSIHREKVSNRRKRYREFLLKRKGYSTPTNQEKPSYFSMALISRKKTITRVGTPRKLFVPPCKEEVQEKHINNKNKSKSYLKAKIRGKQRRKTIARRTEIAIKHHL